MPEPVIDSIFVTKVYNSALTGSASKTLVDELASSCISISNDDQAGHKWCEENSFPGYTSYASLTDLTWRSPTFKKLKHILDKHVAAFVECLEFDLNRKEIKLDSLWINILPYGGVHTSHIHPNSIISGTFYVCVPEFSAAIKFEDPRLAMMMASPNKIANAGKDNRNFFYVMPKVGQILLWESWLRHEVPINMADGNRISISFNYS